ncbi:Uncharacterised protein [Bordetella trematum]|uniref:hypothetical protein n=1 Tax=Bordetella trematum TaxID=123899 RepID=UPI00079880DD|nr:hypothetical protein [Bordetella trematum]SAI62964.1 Uncharacterised protein [Bordetella trematum]
MSVEKPVSCVYAIGALAFVAVAIAFALHYPTESDEWAAWIQAVGSIVAIMGAVYAAREGARTSARMEDMRRQKGVLLVVGLLSDKADAMSKVVKLPGNSWKQEFDKIYAPNSLDGAVRALHSVPALDLPTADAIAALLELQRLFPFVILRADEVSRGPWSCNPDMRAVLEGLRDEVESKRLKRGLSSDAESAYQKSEQGLDKKLEDVTRMQKQNLVEVIGWIHTHMMTLRRELGASSAATRLSGEVQS